MAETIYDRHAAFYVDFVDRSRQAAFQRGNDLILTRIEARLGAALAGARVCDLCCGEGYLGRWLARRGAGQVVGIDLSQALIEVAKARADSACLSYFVEDAARADKVPGGAFDIVVSQMAMMDVADHRALFAAVRRALRAGGAFVFSLLHPCFMAPCHAIEAPPLILAEDGHALAVAVRRYATEGYWNSGGDGVRGRMGSHHRMISTYVNELLANGFRLEAMEELNADQGPYGAPAAKAAASGKGLAAEIPSVLLIAARSI